MRNATELLVGYAACHRDRRNITTHVVGIPFIIFALGVLLARPGFALDGFVLTPAWLLWGAAALWFLTRGHLALGAATAALSGALVALAQPLGAGSTVSWLTCGFGLLLVGWLLQFVGHYYEGRRPAFVGDPASLLAGPMFVTAELLFMMGLCRGLLGEIERRAGPTVLRNLAHP